MSQQHPVRSIVLVLSMALTVFAPAAAVPSLCVAQTPSTAEAKPSGVLPHDELERLIPSSVFFQGQSATVQLRNSGGVRFPDGALMLAVKVDTGGYSSSIQERYQDYLINETTLLLGDRSAPKTLVPGAYGIGFVGANLIVMDIGGHTLFTVPAPTATDLRRPAPLQVLAHDAEFRLYSGRQYIAFIAAPPEQAPPQPH